MSLIAHRPRPTPGVWGHQRHAERPARLGSLNPWEVSEPTSDPTLRLTLASKQRSEA